MRHLLLLSFDLRNKSQYLYQQKWVYSKRAGNCNSGVWASHGKSNDKFNKQGKDHYFIEKKKEVKIGCLNKNPLEQSEISRDDSFSWPVAGVVNFL